VWLNFDVPSEYIREPIALRILSDRARSSRMLGNEVVRAPTERDRPARPQSRGGTDPLPATERSQLRVGSISGALPNEPNATARDEPTEIAERTHFDQGIEEGDMAQSARLNQYLERGSARRSRLPTVPDQNQPRCGTKPMDSGSKPPSVRNEPKLDGGAERTQTRRPIKVVVLVRSNSILKLVKPRAILDLHPSARHAG
jgi:hypothetical protein